MSHLRLANGREILVQQADIELEIAGNELFARYIGLHNRPFECRYPLFSTLLDVESDARLVGDGFQMLSQASGTLSHIQEVGRCPDNNLSYRIYPHDAPKRFYNTLMIEAAGRYLLFGFTSCQRFAGFFEVHRHPQHWVLSAFIDGEETRPQDWITNQLESVICLEGESMSELYQAYAEAISRHHPPRPHLKDPAPMGWCSWYAYYAEVTEQDIKENVAILAERHPELEWVLLDDGYQAFMGDWLTPSKKFPSGIEQVIADIRAQGKKPAIWLAPFIAEADSAVFRQHPDWFVKNAAGQPLKAEEITYGGWRCTPWYVLDCSHPDVQEHLTQVAKTLREEWGVELFKLDANYWGTLQGQRFQSGVTGVEAYRMGMQAIAEGAGDGWLLGCNAPMWPSLGLVDAMRVSDDVERNADRFCQIARETLMRSWQHRQLWQIDPDCLTLTSLPNQSADRASYEFHRNLLLASGGLLLSGDPLPKLTPFAKQSLKRLLKRFQYSQKAAKITSFSMRHAFLPLTDKNDLHCLFNFNGKAQEFTLVANHPVQWYDYWTGEQLSSEPSKLLIVNLEKGLQSRAIFTVG
ncbi:alpha-galactosidase [Vibrio cholerae]|nr:alpha-galactosidase [Vibrio cholerae]EJL6953649.1 alpha-galactosidase [Vibrio cholerae]EKF9813895.1 alpha-galactosidase [Vibrio cholerae]